MLAAAATLQGSLSITHLLYHVLRWTAGLVGLRIGCLRVVVQGAPGSYRGCVDCTVAGGPAMSADQQHVDATALCNVCLYP